MTIKPHPDKIDCHEVFEDGTKTAEFWFCRDRRDIRGRITVKCAGEINFTNGRTARLDHYGWFADIRRDLKNGVLK